MGARKAVDGRRGGQRDPGSGFAAQVPGGLRSRGGGAEGTGALGNPRGVAGRGGETGGDPGWRRIRAVLRGGVMLYLISYDVTDDSRRRHAFEALKDFGRRVQYSVFECNLGYKGVERKS